MNIHEVEGIEELATKKDLQLLSSEMRKEMADLKSALLEHLLTSERGQRAWVWGLYALIILSHFWK